MKVGRVRGRKRENIVTIILPRFRWALDVFLCRLMQSMDKKKDKCPSRYCWLEITLRFPN